MTTTVPDRAPVKALTKAEQTNLEKLIANDYARTRHALEQKFSEHLATIETELAEQFPPEELDVFATELREVANQHLRNYHSSLLAWMDRHPGVKVGNLTLAEVSARVEAGYAVGALSSSGITTGWADRDRIENERRAEAHKARDTALAALTAQELEARRTVLVRGVSSQEALDVLREIPAAVEIFNTQVRELEGGQG